MDTEPYQDRAQNAFNGSHGCVAYSEAVTRQLDLPVLVDLRSPLDNAGNIEIFDGVSRGQSKSQCEAQELSRHGAPEITLDSAGSIKVSGDASRDQRVIHREAQSFSGHRGLAAVLSLRDDDLSANTRSGRQFGLSPYGRMERNFSREATGYVQHLSGSRGGHLGTNGADVAVYRCMEVHRLRVMFLQHAAVNSMVSMPALPQEVQYSRQAEKALASESRHKNKERASEKLQLKNNILCAIKDQAPIREKVPPLLTKFKALEMILSKPCPRQPNPYFYPVPRVWSVMLPDPITIEDLSDGVKLFSTRKGRASLENGSLRRVGTGRNKIAFERINGVLNVIAPWPHGLCHPSRPRLPRF